MKKKIALLLFLIASYFVQGQNIEIDEIIYTKHINPSDELNQLNRSNGTRTVEIKQGLTYTFEFKPTVIMAPELQREMPTIKTYDLYRADEYAGTYTWSEYGVWYYIILDGKQIAVYPDLDAKDFTHIVDFGAKKLKGVTCGLNKTNTEPETERKFSQGEARELTTTFGTELREYRVYFATTGEFYALNGNAAGPVNAIITSTVQGLNALYKNELAVTFFLSGRRVYTDANTDPFEPDFGGPDTRATQAGQVVNTLVGVGNYDIGHVLHKSQDPNIADDGWGSGGLAQLRAVCNDFVFGSGAIAKASGWSGSYSNSGFSWISLIGHELGHMFGAQHTFNGIGNSCSTAISETTAYEIGSGSTIMSYNGICDDDQNMLSYGASDNYFHSNSLLQMIDHIIGSGDCASKNVTTNTAPVVTANPCGAIFNIPRSTPFYLKGMAADAEDDNLTYCWEQFDEDGTGTPTQGLIGAAASGLTNAPLFRSFPPSADAFRYFPALSSVIVSNTNDPFDVLPTVARTVNMKLTVRDNNSAGGAVGIEDLQLKFANSGPLTVGAQSNWNTGDNVTISWNTGGSNSLCSKADVSLSIDGGLTYPYLLADDVNYSAGSVVIPVTGLYPTTSRARIKVACDDYECFYFYDVTNGDFRISAACQAPSSFVCPSENKSFDFGDPGLNMTNSSIVVGDKVTSYLKLVSNTSPTFDIVTFDTNNTSCKEITNDYRAESVVISVDKSGDYVFSVNRVFEDGFGFISVFRNDGFSPSNSCPTFVSSSARWSGSGTSVIATGLMTATLEACTKYRLVFYNFDLGLRTNVTNIAGPGNVIEESSVANPDYSQAYVAVDNATNLISFINMDPNFTSLVSGSYTVYAFSYKSGGPTPPNVTDLNAYLGMPFNQFYIAGDCFVSSANSFNLDIEGSCSLTEVTYGTKSSCNPLTNTFTQELIITYTQATASGNIVVNGQEFPITTSPQTISITLSANGKLIAGDVLISTEPNCKMPFSIQAPENCCPFDLALGDTIKVCSGETFTLDAGDGGQMGSYQWFKDEVSLAETTKNLDVIAAGTYSVIVTNDVSCAKMDTVVVIIENVPTLTLPNDVTICDGSNEMLAVTTNATNIRWTQNGEVLQEGNLKSIFVNSGGVVLVEAYFDEQCIVSDNINVSAIVSPTPDLGDNVFLCEGESATLDGTAIGTYSWFLDDVLLMNETTSTYIADQSGVVRVEVLNSDGCTGEDEVNVTVEGIPTLTVSNDVTICDGEATNLTATTQASLVRWFVDDVLVQGGALTNYIINTGGTVRVRAGNSDACAIEETIIVTAKESPKPKLGFDVSKCEGEEVRLSSKVEDETYVWLKGSTVIPTAMDSFLVVNQGGEYTVEVTNMEGCTGTDIINVQFFDLETIEAGDDITICQGEKAQINATSSTDVFIWYKDGSPYPAIDLDFQTSAPGIYVLEAKNPANCSVFDTLEVIERPIPVVDIGDNKLACIGDAITLKGPTGSFTYQWTKDGGAISMDKDLIVTTTGLYILEVTDGDGCSAEDNATITFEAGPTLSINETEVDLCQGSDFNATVTTNAPMVQWYKNGSPITGATSKTLQIDADGTYSVEAEGAGGCIVTEEVIVTVNGLPNVDLDATNIACEGESIELSSNVLGDQYSWTFNGAEISTEEKTDVSAAGTYTLVVTNEFGCTASDVTAVSFVPLPTVTLNESATFCEGESVSVSAISNGGTFEWSLNGVPIAGATSKTITISEEGIYSFKASGQGSCANTKTLEVVEVSAPVVDLETEKTLCPGESFTVNAGPNAGSTFKWSSGETTASILIENDNVTSKSVVIYKVDVTNASNCKTSDEISVTRLPIIVANITTSNDGVCTGDSLLLIATGGEDYSWTGTPGTFQIVNDESILVFPSEATDYFVNVTDQCPGNEDNSSINIDVFTPGLVSAGNDTCVIIGKSINLKANGGIGYLWEDDNSIIGSLTTSNPEVKPLVETTYKVEITDLNGCLQSDEVTVCIITNPFSIFKSVTAITPNGDGFNDQLEFPGLEAFEDNKLVIFNRWGNIIYEKNGYQKDGYLFDGKRNGEELPADTYYYVLTFDEYKVKETLTIIRSR